jgi:hypothetical protein
MRSLGFVLLLVAAAALIKPSGVVGSEEEGWEGFLLQWRQHTSLPAPLLNGDLVSHPDTLLFVAFDSIHGFMDACFLWARGLPQIFNTSSLCILEDCFFEISC